MAIHPTAQVAASAELGEDVVVGAYSVVGARVRIGARTRLHAHVVVDGDTWLGEDCEVFPFAVLGTLPQDKKLRDGDGPGRLRIGDRNRIREHVTIHGGTSFGGGETRIGNDNMLLVGCHIGHDASVGNHVVFTNGAMAAGHTVIADRAILGAMTGIHQFARIGELAMIGAGAMVSNDAPPFALVQGDRARLVGVNVVGLHRHGYDQQQKAAIKRVFRLLFWRPGTIQGKLEQLRASRFWTDPVCRKVLEFVGAASKRGLCSPRSTRHAEPGAAEAALAGRPGEDARFGAGQRGEAAPGADGRPQDPARGASLSVHSSRETGDAAGA